MVICLDLSGLACIPGAWDIDGHFWAIGYTKQYSTGVLTFDKPSQYKYFVLPVYNSPL